jgi:hypothetical protein
LCKFKEVKNDGICFVQERFGTASSIEGEEGVSAPTAENNYGALGTPPNFDGETGLGAGRGVVSAPCFCPDFYSNEVLKWKVVFLKNW